MAKKVGTKKKLKEKQNSEIGMATRRRAKKFKNPKHSKEHKTPLLNDNYLDEGKMLEQYDINECLNGIQILDNFISESNEEMTFIKLPFHVNLIRKRNTGYTKYTKEYRKRMLKLIGFGNRFGPHYHKDEEGHIYSMEYTDRITSKSLIFFRCQLKGCRAKGVFNSNTKKFIVSQKHALPYENHIPNKKSYIKMLIEKTFAEKSYIKDIQIIFCRYYGDMKNKSKLDLNNSNVNINIFNNINNLKDINKENNVKTEYKKNCLLLEGKERKINKNEISINDNINEILIKKEINRGELFKNFYDNKYQLGENKYEEYINKIIFTNMENQRETKEFFYEVEININDFKSNKKTVFNLEENKILGNRYHKNIKNEIYVYSYEDYNKEDKNIIFLCKYEGCTGKAYYNLKTRKFSIVVPHLFSYQMHYDNLYQQIENYKKVAKIYDTIPDIIDIQFILKYKNE